MPEYLLFRMNLGNFFNIWFNFPLSLFVQVNKDSYLKFLEK